MLTIEEYIAKRKKEDGLNEFDFGSRNQNLKICVDYIFEYYNNYLGTTEADEKTVLQNEKTEKYKKLLIDYDSEVREWLIGIFNDYNKQINLSIAKVIRECDLFYLYNTDAEFRSLSYECYSQLIKRNPFMRDQTEMLFQFIKNYHRVKSQGSVYTNKTPTITEEIDEWINDTRAKHNVNLLEFAFNWVLQFCNNENAWPKTHCIKGSDGWCEYDYKQKSNLFNIDSLYRRMPKKPFIKGKKQEFEILFMYYWTHNIDTDKDYWDEYIGKVLPSLNT